ncbi:hypothetical protein EDC39_10642 [Geothermobacter ehrlichii]|uniref:HTH cro/C1-type domain-containing protein n=2 Tax=Geothermobacter ehrlichii TaxID=213224 RepID=A0A5D3WK45_9BACT|nr:hypothetical protein EDC39_10642 [Geothermobacter ehrlichii]
MGLFLAQLEKGAHILRGVCPFTNNPQFLPPHFNITTRLKLPQHPDLEKEPLTLGEHLRRKRIELGLKQKDLAARLGGTASTVWSWEHGWKIGKRYYPKVIDFLGYRPAPEPDETLLSKATEN